VLPRCHAHTGSCTTAAWILQRHTSSHTQSRNLRWCSMPLRHEEMHPAKACLRSGTVWNLHPCKYHQRLLPSQQTLERVQQTRRSACASSTRGAPAYVAVLARRAAGQQGGEGGGQMQRQWRHVPGPQSRSGTVTSTASRPGGRHTTTGVRPRRMASAAGMPLMCSRNRTRDAPAHPTAPPPGSAAGRGRAMLMFCTQTARHAQQPCSRFQAAPP
jgi:hypothetical protein